MKKTVSILLLAVLCLGMCACENSRGGEDLGTAVWEKAYYLDAFNDPTEEYYIGTAKRLSGSYSSDSVTDGKLEAEIRVDEQIISIFLYENGTDLVKNGDISSIEFSGLMKTADGSKVQLYGGMYSGGDCVEIWEDQTQSVLHFEDREPQENPVAKALCAEDGEVSFYLTREDQPATSYLFTVRTGNFAALYETEITTPIREGAYARAEALLAAENYDNAIAVFTALGDYRDSPARAAEADAARIEALNADAYAKAEALFTAKDYDGAIAAFTALGDYRDSAARVEETREAQKADAYAKAEAMLAAKDYSGAITAFTALGDYRDSPARVNEAREELKELHAARIEADNKPIAAGGYHTIGLQADGSVVAVGSNDYIGNYCGQCEVSGWSDIIAVAAGGHHTVGLRGDGTVVAVGFNEDGRCEVSDWTRIVAIAANNAHTVGLKADGTVFTVGRNEECQCEVSDWTDIVAVAAGRYHTVGLKADGTVIAVGNNEYGQCEVSDWTDIRLP